MPNLFETGAYPIITRVRDIVAALKEPHVKVARYRNPGHAGYYERLRAGITALDVPEVAQKYVLKDGLAREAASGQVLHDKNFTEPEVAAQAEQAAIALTPTALTQLTQTGNRLRAIYRGVYQGYTGDLESTIYGHVLFTPKGGTGRSPEIHSDFLEVAGHASIALSTIDLPNEDLGEKVWTSINRRRLNTLDASEQAALKEQMIRLGRLWQHKFSPTEFGEFNFMKGQRQRDLDVIADRAQVGIHKSGQGTETDGQVAFLFFTRTRKPAP